MVEEDLLQLIFKSLGSSTSNDSSIEVTADGLFVLPDRCGVQLDITVPKHAAVSVKRVRISHIADIPVLWKVSKFLLENVFAPHFLIKFKKLNLKPKSHQTTTIILPAPPPPTRIQCSYS